MPDPLPPYPASATRSGKSFVLRLLILWLSLAASLHVVAQQPVGFAYYDADRLYDTIPALFYDDSDFTPCGRLRWTAERYARKITHTSAVLDSMRMDIVALAGVENEAVVRDLVAACGEDYCYIHRTFNTFDGLDIALLYHGDRFFPDYVEQGRGWLYVEGELPAYSFSAIPIAEAGSVSYAGGNHTAEPLARSAVNPLVSDHSASHASSNRSSPQDASTRIPSGNEPSRNATSSPESNDGLSCSEARPDAPAPSRNAIPAENDLSHNEALSDNRAPFRHAIPSGDGHTCRNTQPRNRPRRLGILACNNPRYAAEAIADCRENHSDVQLIAAGRFRSEHASRHGMRDLTAAAESRGHGNIRYRNGWRMQDRILADTALLTTGADAYLRRFLFDLRSATPVATYEKTVYRGGYGSLLPVFTYLE